jgi:hypothetical protein
LQENQPESFRHTRRKRMEIENKLKAMGLELPAAGPDRPAAPGRSKLATSCSWAGTRRDWRIGASWEPV